MLIEKDLVKLLSFFILQLDYLPALPAYSNTGVLYSRRYESEFNG